MTNNSLAQDHLVPDIPYVIGTDEYSSKLKSVFTEGYAKNVVLRVLVLPSFTNEHLIGIRKVKNNYETFIIEPSSSVADDAKIKTIILKKEISNELSSRFIDAWEFALLNVRHVKKPPLVLDGTYYYLSMFLHKYGDISGKLVSPKKGSEMEALANLIKALGSYSKGEIDNKTLSNYLTLLEGYNDK